MGSRGSRAGTTLKSRVPGEGGEVGVSGWTPISRDSRGLYKRPTIQVSGLPEAERIVAEGSSSKWTGGAQGMVDGLVVAKPYPLNVRPGIVESPVFDAKGTHIGELIQEGQAIKIRIVNRPGPIDNLEHRSIKSAVTALGMQYDHYQRDLRDTMTGTRQAKAKAYPLAWRFMLAR